MIGLLLARLWPYLLATALIGAFAAWLLHTGAQGERQREMQRQSEAARKADEASRDYRRDGGADSRLREGRF